MAKYTAGPWYYDKKLGSVYVIERYDSHNDEIIIASDVSRHDGSLIAMAPQMLELLQVLIKSLDRSEHRRIIKVAQDIIRKAKGR